MRFIAAALTLAVCLAFGHSSALAQAAAGWYLIPSFNLTEQYDDNIFGTSSNRVSDFVSRFSPGLQGGYRSEPFTLFLLGELTAEVFAKNPDLNSATSGKRAGLTAQYLPNRLLTLGFDLGYVETESVTSLNPLLAGPGGLSGPGGVTLTPTNPAPTTPAPPTTGPTTPGTPGPTTPPAGTAPTIVNPIVNTTEFGRQKAALLYIAPSVKYTLSPLAILTAGYSFTRATLENSPTNEDHSISASVSYQITPRDTGHVRYTLDIFRTTGTDALGLSTNDGTQVSNALTLGWSRQLTQTLGISLAAGPRFTEGSVSPEVQAGLSYAFRLLGAPGSASLSYGRSESVVLGGEGPSKTETYAAGVGVEPIRNLAISLGGTITKLSAVSSTGTTSSTSGSGDTTTYGVSLGATYQVLRWLIARAGYTYQLQTQDSGDIRRNVISVSLEVLYPYRVDQ